MRRGSLLVVGLFVLGCRDPAQEERTRVLLETAGIALDRAIDVCERARGGRPCPPCACATSTTLPSYTCECFEGSVSHFSGSSEEEVECQALCAEEALK